MTDPNDATLAAYQSRVPEYLRGSPSPPPELTAFLDRFASLTGAGPVLEIGSGPGRDADYLESHGVRVIRTDATPAFVDLLRALAMTPGCSTRGRTRSAARTRGSWLTPCFST